LDLSKKASLFEALGYLLSSTAIGVASTSGEAIKSFYQNLFMGIELYELPFYYFFLCFIAFIMAILYVINKIFSVIYLIVDSRYPRHQNQSNIRIKHSRSDQNDPIVNDPIDANDPIVNDQIDENDPIVNDPIDENDLIVNDPIDPNDPIVNDPINQVALNSIAKFHPKSDKTTDKIPTGKSLIEKFEDLSPYDLYIISKTSQQLIRML